MVGTRSSTNLLLHHFLNDADDGHLSLVLGNVKPHTRIDQDLEHDALSTPPLNGGAERAGLLLSYHCSAAGICEKSRADL